MTLLEIPQTGELVSQSAGMSYKLTKDLLDKVRPFFQFFLAFVVLDYLMTMWDNSDLFSSWRSNNTANQIKSTLDNYFGANNADLGRGVIIMLLYACVTYVSSRKYAKSVLSVSGPMTLALSAGVVQVVLRLTTKYSGSYNTPSGVCEDNSVGCTTWDWLSKWTDLMLGYNNNDDYTSVPIILGMVAGFLTARIQKAI